jgi:hypothetical protein
LLERGTPLALVLVIITALSGCDGRSGGSGSNTAADLRATVQMSAVPTVVNPGGQTYISWSAENATSCQASGGWSGERPATGSFRTSALTTDTTFALTCGGDRGGAVARLTVVVGSGVDQGAPIVTLKSVPASIPANGTTQLEWTATGADSCQAAGDWSGSKPAAGTQVVSGIQKDSSFKLTCSGIDQTGVAMTSVVLQRATLRWTAPSENAGSVAGYHVFWGTETGRREHKVTILDPSIRAHVIDLPSAGSFYFAMAAFDTKGIEGARSNEVSKHIPR